jgi:DNA-directed RNA polymerase specialized sigma24 family protein
MMAAVAASIPPFERFYAEHRDEVLRLLRRRLGAAKA